MLVELLIVDGPVPIGIDLLEEGLQAANYVEDPRVAGGVGKGDGFTSIVNSFSFAVALETKSVTCLNSINSF